MASRAVAKSNNRRPSRPRYVVAGKYWDQHMRSVIHTLGMAKVDNKRLGPKRAAKLAAWLIGAWIDEGMFNTYGERYSR